MVSPSKAVSRHADCLCKGFQFPGLSFSHVDQWPLALFIGAGLALGVFGLWLADGEACEAGGVRGAPRRSWEL